MEQHCLYPKIRKLDFLDQNDPAEKVYLTTKGIILLTAKGRMFSMYYLLYNKTYTNEETDRKELEYFDENGEKLRVDHFTAMKAANMV